MKEQRNCSLIIGLTITIALALMAIIGHFWTPCSPTAMDSSAVNLAPCLKYPLGTDNFGRDILSRIMKGSGITYLVAVCTVLIGAIGGTIIGAFTGYFGGIPDEIVMRLNDVLLSFPSVLLALLYPGIGTIYGFGCRIHTKDSSPGVAPFFLPDLCQIFYQRFVLLQIFVIYQPPAPVVPRKPDALLEWLTRIQSMIT